MKFILPFWVAFFFIYNANAQSFKRITDGIVVNDRGPSSSCSWADYNNDDYPDLYVTNGESSYNNFFYKNNGNGTFTKIEFRDIVYKDIPSFGASWGDYDNDGNLDLYVANGDYYFATGAANLLFKNLGDGEFQQIKNGSIVNDYGGSYACAWADYNNDGFLDMFVANNYLDLKNFLYKNNGDGTFTRITEGSIVNDQFASISCVWGDYNNDRYPDLYVNNVWTNGDYTNNSLYKNNGDGTFTKITNDIITKQKNDNRSSSWGDFNNDGYLDLAHNAAGEHVLYVNNTNGSFSKLVLSSGDGCGGGTVWNDFDNDGYLDLIMAKGCGTPHAFYKNNGNGTFTQIYTTPLSDRALALDRIYGIATEDYDNDGLMDLFLTSRNTNSPNYLLKNNTENCNSWLKVSLQGLQSNSFGVGAKVKTYARINGKPHMQMREQNCQSGGGYSGQGGFNLNFGMGDASIVDSLIVEWPSGQNTILKNVKVDSFIKIKEDGSSTYKQKPFITSGGNNECSNIEYLEAIDFTAPVKWYAADNPDVILSSGSKLVLSYSDESMLYVAEGKCHQRDTFLVKNNACSPIPNLVTINNDGKNDFFILPELEDGWKVEVYNRWGDLVFNSNNYNNNWPQGIVSDGIYYYSIVRNDNRYKYNGWVEIVKGKELR